MSQSGIALVSEQIQKKWAPQFIPALREKTLLPSLVNKDYSGDIKFKGDTVYVSQITDPVAQLRTIGTDADVFESAQLSMTRVAVTADKRITAAYEFEDLVQIQSQLGEKDSEIRDALMFGCMKSLNDYLYSLVSPSTSSPDHLLNSVTDMNAAQIAAIRLLAAKAKWERMKGWYGLLDPSYYSDVLNATGLVSADYVADQPIVGGVVGQKRFGFNLLEDDSRGTDKGLFFHPDFMALVMQVEPKFEVSSLHSQKKHGFLISCDMIVGAKLLIDGSKKHIWATAAASGIGA